MTPRLILVFAAIALAVFWIKKNRIRAKGALQASLMHVLDALVVGYLIYLVAASIFDFKAYDTWSGTGRLLFFAGSPSGGQFFGIAIGVVFGALRFMQDGLRPASTSTLTTYKGGRRIWCHNSALTVSNAMLAARAEKAGSRRPQHLSPDVDYSGPDDPNELDQITPVPGIESLQAVRPYFSQPGEAETVLWGMLRVPYEDTKTHFLAVGATGSGKTLMIHGLMKTVLPRIGRGEDFRAFVYDDKPDFLPFAKQLGIEQYVWNFDPFDTDGVAWDIASDVTSFAESEQIASVLCPVDQNLHEPYFQQAAQGFLCAVLISFMRCSGKNWTLRDVMLAFASKRRLEKILNRDEQSIRRALPYLSANRSAGEVLSTLRTKIGPYEIPAALWTHAKTKKSVREWHSSKAILLARSREIFSQAVKPINQALFRMASLYLLNEEDSETRSTWVFLDEIREIGKLQGYHALANKGRSKGVRMVLGFQSIAGMMAEHGKDAAEEIASVCGHRTFFHLDCGVTRNWAASHMGNITVDETVFQFSINSGKGGVSRSVSWDTKRQVRQSMEASDFDENLKRVSPENGFIALNTAPAVGTYVSWVPFSWVTDNLPRAKEGEEKLRPVEHQKLDDWGPADLERLGLPADFLNDELPETAQDQKAAATEKQKEGETGGPKSRGKGGRKTAGDMPQATRPTRQGELPLEVKNKVVDKPR